MAKLGPSSGRQSTEVDQVTVAPVAGVRNLMCSHCAKFTMSENFVFTSKYYQKTMSRVQTLSVSSIKTHKPGSVIFLDLPEESPRESEKFGWSVQKDSNKIRKANRTDRALH